jgi:predicted GNAT family acetyltransferase
MIQKMDYKYEENRIYAEDQNGDLLVKADINTVGEGVVEITHVFTAPSLRGQGAAGKLMQAVAEYLRKNNLKAIATCSYANSWFEKNRELWEDVIAAGNDQIPLACKIDGEH